MLFVQSFLQGWGQHGFTRNKDRCVGDGPINTFQKELGLSILSPRCALDRRLVSPESSIHPSNVRIVPSMLWRLGENYDAPCQTVNSIAYALGCSLQCCILGWWNCLAWNYFWATLKNNVFSTTFPGCGAGWATIENKPFCLIQRWREIRNGWPFLHSFHEVIVSIKTFFIKIVTYQNKHFWK